MKGFMALAAACFMALTTVALAAEQLREIRWTDLQAAGQITTGAVVPGGAGSQEECLMVENKGDGPMTAQLAVIERPGISLPVYALRGRVRYEDISGTGYVEMWSHFSDGGAYFTRTLGTDGPMQSLHGSSAWREMIVPFSAAGTPNRPSKLVLNVVLPGKGRVWLSPLRLFQYREDENPLAISGAWWTDRQAGIIGGIGGAMLGLLGTVIGILCPKGRARSFVIGTLATVTTVGAVVLVLGLWALFVKQPYGVYYPLLLTGGLAAVIFGALIPVARRRYAEIELCRMGAADIR